MSKLEKTLMIQLLSLGLRPEAEYRFHPTRRWRFDFAFVEQKLAIEVEGITFWGKNKNGTMKLGRHQTGKGIENDLEKYSEAARLGWNVYRCGQKLINSGQALIVIETVLKRHEEE